METRIVEIEKYWAAVVGNAAEFKQIAAAENPEFNSLSSCILRVLGEAFIHDATEYGVARWESMLGIAPKVGDTLEQRKVRVLTYLNVQLPYTWRVLKQMISSYVGEDNFTMEYINDFSKLIVRVITEDDVVFNDIQLLLSKVVPQNVVIDLDYGA